MRLEYIAATWGSSIYMYIHDIVPLLFSKRSLYVVIYTGQNEAMECEGSICRNKSAQMQQLSTESGNSTQKKGNSTHVHREILAAEEFDRTSDCTLDFDLHID